ncbi:hypothetical protein Taro_031210 [Colocasia esculenta]|uniref:Potassium channel tetramerisation-type BTB domain-containing protein n=1 Tax=Colocasia esculenta TaxID=4460 RepID=A0A843VYE2_COLES|nr:hypothetical protein [Colocasia esculenta]
MAVLSSDDSTFATTQSLHNHVKLNVDDIIFETTVCTLHSGGPDSLLTVVSGAPSPQQPIFIDRDPEVFSVLLSLLCIVSLPSSARHFPMRELAEEALYYGMEPLLRVAAALPPLQGFDAAPIAVVPLATVRITTTFSVVAEDGFLWIAHRGQISTYDWTFSYAGTVRTHLDEIVSLRHAWQDVEAVGSLESLRLHLYDIAGGRHMGAIHWIDPSDARIYKATVAAIAADLGPTGDTIYASFECPHCKNCILAVDYATL